MTKTTGPTGPTGLENRMDAMRAALRGVRTGKKKYRGRDAMLLARKHLQQKAREKWEQQRAAEKFQTGGPNPLLVSET